jgi:hypothetical protein
MRTTNSRLTQLTIAVGALALAMAAATPASALIGPALTIRAVAAQGNEVAITVCNQTTRTQTGTVTAQVLTSSGEILVTAQVTAAAGQSATVTTVLPEPVLDVLPMGVVVDDGVPF